MQLVYGVLAALPFLAIRVGYGVASLILELEHPTSSFLSSIGVKAGLSLLPEVIMQLIFIAAGLATINVNREIAQEKSLMA
jgi:hypothetical protein